MKTLRERIAAAPITWGVSEVPGWGHQLSAKRVLNEMRDLGIFASELGPNGYFARDKNAVKEIRTSEFSIVAGFVPITFSFPGGLVTSYAELDGIFSELKNTGAEYAVLAVSSDESGYNVRPRLQGQQWQRVLKTLDVVNEMVNAHGMRPVLHTHFGTYIESAEDTLRILDGSDVGLCLDTGHLALAGDDPVALATAVPQRVQHVHLKDVDLDLAAAVRTGTIPYYEAVKDGLFKPLGQGDLKIDDLIHRLEAAGYQGWYVLEQDVILPHEPTAGSGPVHDAKISLDYLARIDVKGLAA